MGVPALLVRTDGSAMALFASASAPTCHAHSMPREAPSLSTGFDHTVESEEADTARGVATQASSPLAARPASKDARRRACRAQLTWS